MKNICFRSVLLSLGVFLSSSISLAQDVSPSPGTTTEPNLRRNISIRAYEIFQQRKLRLHLSVDESDSSGHYFLNTLDAKSFRLMSAEADELPVEPSSLSTFSTRSPTLPRETAIVFEAEKSLSPAQFESMRSGIAGFLDRFRSDVLTVRASVAEKDVRLAWIAPGQSENPRAIQRAILESKAIDGKPGVAAGVCAALGELRSSTHDRSVVQKTLIFISRPALEGDKHWSELKSCLSKSDDANIRIFWVRVHDQNADFGKFDEVIRSYVEKSGGFVSRVNATTDPVVALKNLRSYLDDEYVLEFDLTQHRPYSDVLKFKVSANYHGNLIRSEEAVFEGFVALPRPEEIKRIEEIRENERRKERRTYLFLFGVFLSSALVIVLLLRRNNAGCSKCGFRVAKNFQDCPFRNQKCFGRISVIQGPLQGYEFPLFVGENTLGSSLSRTIRLRAKGLAGNHAKIVLTQRKALFSPEKGAETRVNGVMATEPRLVSSGTILRMGELVCRIDFKEGS
ncbi:MAG: Inner rane component of cytoplasmic domain [Pseudomonadota bacterium]